MGPGSSQRHTAGRREAPAGAREVLLSYEE